MQTDRLSNGIRARWALDALADFALLTRVDTARDAIGDLIVDLLHLAHGRGLDPHYLVQGAVCTLDEELTEDADDEMTVVLAKFLDLLPDDGPGFQI